ncbi:MAG: SPASM domain-containing protein [Treponema sp.]|nr:SPASM domain-containing protein [Treponema sp.]
MTTKVDGFFVSERSDSYLVYDRNLGYMHFLRDKRMLSEVCEEIAAQPERPSIYHKSGDYAFKMNLSNVCNLNCDYCFRNKEGHVGTDVLKAKEIIDYVVKNYSDKVIDFSFSVNLTSEALLEFKKIKEIKAYLEEKTNPLFSCEDFDSIEEALNFLVCFPVELVGKLDVYSSIEEIVNAMNECLKKKYMVSLFPLPEGMSLPQWEASQYKNAENLEERNLYLFNRRFMEVLFPETFKRKPSYSFFICTNGTFYSDEIVQFFREINLDNICVSLDGPSSVHDKHRYFYDFSASHALILENIKKFMQSGLKVSVASVLTADFPYPLQLSEYFSTLGVAGISMVCVRTGKKGSFDEESIEKLINGYRMLFDRFFDDICKGDYSLINLLSGDYCFTGVKLLLSKGRLSRRCGWNEDTIFDPNGDVYPCDYFVGKKEFLRGGINSDELVDVCSDKLDVDSREKCKDCWCKYLCGGTCYYNSMLANGDIGIPEAAECKLNMGVRELSIKFVHRLLEEGIDLYEFGKKIGIYYDDRVSFKKRFFVRKGVRFSVEGTLSKVEMEIKRIEGLLLDEGAKIKEEVFISVKNIRPAGVNKILDVEVIIPYDGGKNNQGLGVGTFVREFDFGECVSGLCGSEEESVEEMKRLIGDAARNFGLAVDGSFWFKAKPSAFFGYKNSNVDVFLQKKNFIY